MELDFYLDIDNTTKRLVDEWKKYGKIIIGVDYDDTIFDFHNKGRRYDYVINLLRDCKKLGCHIIICSCCSEDKYDSMRKYMNDNDIPFDSINEDADFIEFNGRKIYTNVLLDDRAGLPAAYGCLYRAYHEIINEKYKILRGI
jgi:hypothetical protein